MFTFDLHFERVFVFAHIIIFFFNILQFYITHAYSLLACSITNVITYFPVMLAYTQDYDDFLCENDKWAENEVRSVLLFFKIDFADQIKSYNEKLQQYR